MAPKISNFNRYKKMFFNISGVKPEMQFYLIRNVLKKNNFF